ncbi:hypothetical protein OUZ56_019049 [Daphnia magna]|uniref:PAS domain-containing protein n=1 Tax=Daphnia magna TaxID=35525 RepID=A0ABQ9ZAI0_9CRUS|nr:hypothetical protein OUZ56_019049 [Daphnia magna]
MQTSANHDRGAGFGLTFEFCGLPCVSQRAQYSEQSRVGWVGLGGGPRFQVPEMPARSGPTLESVLFTSGLDGQQCEAHTLPPVATHNSEVVSVVCEPQRLYIRPGPPMAGPSSIYLSGMAMNGFLMMMTQNGKLLYISDNAAEYLGHSMSNAPSKSLANGPLRK